MWGELHSVVDTGLLLGIVWQLAEMKTIVRGHGARLTKLEKEQTNEYDFEEAY